VSEDNAKRFSDLKPQLDAGETPQVTVRTILSWYGAKRRSGGTVLLIRKDLDKLSLETVPDFASPHIDTAVTIRRKPAQLGPIGSQTPVAAADTVAPTTHDAVESADSTDSVAVVKQPEPAHQISRLRSANTPPVWVKPDTTVKEAITIMLARDFSQLPVMQSERDPRGIFSWKSLGSRLALGQRCIYVRECMDDHTELGPTASLYDAIPLIVKHECVLIRDTTKKIGGIVTPADLSVQFRELAEPFLLLGAIETHLRGWIALRFTIDDMRAARDPEDTEREINDVSDLTFGEYVRLLENPEKWEKLQLSIDRKTFVERLSQIRTIRNDVMHFDPDPLDPLDLEALRQFSQFLGPVW
jgi:CBS domain-containing protein